MSNTVRLGIAAVVVAVAAIIGFTYINNKVGTDQPAPSSTPGGDESTSNPTPVAVQPLPSDGPLSPGRYAIDVPDSTVKAEVTVSVGWLAGGDAVHSTYIGSVSFWTVANVPADACDHRGTLPDPPIGSTVDALVSALDAQLNTDMTPAVDVSIGGYEGKRVELRPSSTVPELCESLWWVTAYKDPVGRTIEGAPGDGFDAIWILDVDGQRVVVVGFWGRQSDMAAVTDIVDSIGFPPR